MAIPRGTTPGSNVLLSPCAAPHIQAVPDLADDTALPKEILLDCSVVCQDGPSSIHMPGDPGGTGSAILHCGISSLSLPMKLLTPDYSVPETTNTVLSLQQFPNIRMWPQELWWDAGKDLSGSQPGRGDMKSRGSLEKPGN